MTQELITDLDRVVLKRAAALLEEAGFRFSCSATVEVDHEAGRVLVLSALDVEQDRVGIGFQLSDALARMRSDVPIACRALSSRATRQIADVSQDFYRPEALAARVDVARWIGDEAVNRAVACAGLVSGDSQGVSDADWFGVFRPVQHPSIGRAEKLFLNFRSARALAVTSASLRRLVEAADPLDAADVWTSVHRYESVMHAAQVTPCFEAGSSAAFQAWLSSVRANHGTLEHLVRFEALGLHLDGVVWTTPDTPPSGGCVANTHYSLAA